MNGTSSKESESRPRRSDGSQSDLVVLNRKPVSTRLETLFCVRDLRSRAGDGRRKAGLIILNQAERYGCEYVGALRYGVEFGARCAKRLGIGLQLLPRGWTFQVLVDRLVETRAVIDIAHAIFVACRPLYMSLGISLRAPQWFGT
jgi:hypothetical protein